MIVVSVVLGVVQLLATHALSPKMTLAALAKALDVAFVANSREIGESRSEQSEATFDEANLALVRTGHSSS